MTVQEENTQPAEFEQRPPFAGKWSRIYWIVVINHIVLIILFYLLTLSLA